MYIFHPIYTFHYENLKVALDIARFKTIEQPRNIYTDQWLSATCSGNQSNSGETLQGAQLPSPSASALAQFTTR